MPGEVRWSITESDRPKGRDLADLQARAAALQAFPAAPMDKREAMIARLFLRFPSGGKATEEEVTCYAMDLAEFPAWAISRGITDIIAGRVLDRPEFRPSSLQVRAAVEARAATARDELTLITGLLTANVVPDSATLPPLERRKKLAAQARQMIQASAVEAAPVAKRNLRLPSAFDGAHVPRTGSGRLSDEALAGFGIAPRHDVEDAA